MGKRGFLAPQGSEGRGRSDCEAKSPKGAAWHHKMAHTQKADQNQDTAGGWGRNVGGNPGETLVEASAQGQGYNLALLKKGLA